MANKKETLETTTEEKLLSKISTFSTINKKWITIALAAIVVLLIAVVIITSSVKKSSESAFIRVSKYQDSLNDMVASEESAAVAEYLASVEKEIKGSKYPSVKAAYILGEYYAQKEDWAKSYDYFNQAYNLNSEIYLGSLAAFNAAVAAEEKGDAEVALALYSEVSQDSSNPLVTKALFNVGRINYQKGNKDLAKVTFQQLVDTYPNSEYAKIAASIVDNL